MHTLYKIDDLVSRFAIIKPTGLSPTVLCDSAALAIVGLCESQYNDL